MCEAPSTWRASTWAIEARSRIAAYSGLIAAPGTPKAWLTPSFSITRTAAIAAFIFAMCVSLGSRMVAMVAPHAPFVNPSRPIRAIP